LDWEPIRIKEQTLRVQPLAMVGHIILDDAEAHWLMGCFKCTGWWRRPIYHSDSRDT
jgi:hypothetical protein